MIKHHRYFFGSLAVITKVIRDRSKVPHSLLNLLLLLALLSTLPTVGNPLLTVPVAHLAPCDGLRHHPLPDIVPPPGHLLSHISPHPVQPALPHMEARDQAEDGRREDQLRPAFAMDNSVSGTHPLRVPRSVAVVVHRFR